VRQLITRLDDDLLARLKERAAAEGRSVNALVNDILASEVGGRSPKAVLRLRAGDRLFRPPMPARIPSRAVLARASRGSGTAVSDALTRGRAR
jgi:plasmid stability protein